MNKAIFLDRDGVINKNTHYVNCVEDFHILPGVKEAINLFKAAGYKVIVVTNQGGIEKGFLTELDLFEIHDKMLQELPEIDDIIYCPDYTSFNRKPNPGMLYEMAVKHQIWLGESWMCGDMITDCMAGKRAGCNTALIVNSIVDSMKYNDSPYINFQADGLLAAAKHIITNW